jgi:hypothetical protein
LLLLPLVGRHISLRIGSSSTTGTTTLTDRLPAAPFLHFYNQATSTRLLLPPLLLLLLPPAYNGLSPFADRFIFHHRVSACSQQQAGFLLLLLLVAGCHISLTDSSPTSTTLAGRLPAGP